MFWRYVNAIMMIASGRLQKLMKASGLEDKLVTQASIE